MTPASRATPPSPSEPSAGEPLPLPLDLSSPGQPAEPDAPDAAVIWQLALRQLESKVKPHNFDMWIRPIQCLSVDRSAICLRAPNRFIKEWFEDNYLPALLEDLSAAIGQAPVVVIDVQSPSEADAADAADAMTAAMAPVVSTPEPASRAAIAVTATAPPGAGRPGDENLLHGKYTFDNFVMGPSNQLALAASRAVAELPAGKYNPLFIYGGVGLGKTHLLRAIGQSLAMRNPTWRLLYLKAEGFMNEYIDSVRGGKIAEFRAKYRDSCDVLLMDDIQFIAGKDRTQEEFFHTFNSLFESHRQMVFTADRYPHEIPDLEDRIRSRFQWGLIADIQPPELETRIAILEKKAALDGIDLPKDVSIFLATNIKSNVRELEGLLIRVAATASLQKKTITVDFARDTIRHFLSQSVHQLTIEAVQKEVSNYFSLKPADLKSARRHQLIARPRQVAMYLSRKLVKASFPEIGQRFGGKDHTTVISACRKIESLLATDPKTRHAVERLEHLLTQ